MDQMMNPKGLVVNNGQAWLPVVGWKGGLVPYVRNRNGGFEMMDQPYGAKYKYNYDLWKELMR